MSASNWVRFNMDRDESPNPNRSNRYQVDNVGLQVGLGLPLQVIDLGANPGEIQMPHFFGRIRIPKETYDGQRTAALDSNHVSKDEIQHTVDGIPIRTLYVTNIDISTKHQELYYIFGHFGEVLNVFIGQSNKGYSKCFGFVTYNNPRDAARVLSFRKINDMRFGVLYVKPADSWHQPVEGPNGEISRRHNEHKQEDESEEEDAVQSSGFVAAVKEETDSLNVLNDDCLMHIFSFLSYRELTGVELVCKRWQTLSFEMWRRLRKLKISKFLFGKKSIDTPTLEHLLKRCGSSLTDLDMSAPPFSEHNFSESTLAVVAKYCSDLETLRVENIPIGNRSLAHLGRRCPQLKKLILHGCSKFNDSDLMSLFPKCSQLTHFELAHNNTVIGKWLMYISNPITNLKLSECLAIVPQYLIAGLQKMSSTLKSLTLHINSPMLSKDMDELVAAVPDLDSLSLRHGLLYQRTENLNLERLTQLTILDLSVNPNVTDNVISNIVNGCVNLSHLNLSGSGGGSVGKLTERGLSMIGKMCKLTVLDISYLDATNNTSVTNITTRNTQLQQLFCRGCPGLADEACSHVVSMCLKLELFDLSGCDIGQQTINAALTSVKMRTNNVPLRLIVGGTNVVSASPPEGVEPSDQLTVDLRDLCEEHMRPDYFDLFFPDSDSSDGEDDMDHLCFDCDFDYDDLYDPMHFPGGFDDDTPKFGHHLDYSDCDDWEDDSGDEDDN